MKTGKYRIKSNDKWAFAPQYERKFLWFTWWCYFDDVGLDGLIGPVVYSDKSGAEKFIECQMADIIYETIN